MQSYETNLFFEKDEMFTQSKLCKLYKVTDAQPSGTEMHYHDYMQMWYVVKGSCKHVVEGTSHLLEKDEIFIIPPKVEHMTTPLANTEIICCEFSYEDFFNDGQEDLYDDIYASIIDFSSIWCFLSEESDIHSHFKLQVEISEIIKSKMSYMLNIYTKAELYFEQIIRTEIISLLILLSREYKKSPLSENITALHERYKPMVEKAIVYVNENFAKPLKLEEVCKISMVSKTYFCYIFKMITQRTFIEYLIDLRVQKAVELLKDLDNSITWIGFEVGFNDSTHFSRTFKKVKGISPRAFRTMHCR